jgi:hypothetical protein
MQHALPSAAVLILLSSFAVYAQDPRNPILRPPRLLRTSRRAKAAAATNRAGCTPGCES